MTGPESTSSELRRSIGEAAERIHAIIDAAEKTALEIRAEAVREGDRYLADKRAEAERRIESSSSTLEALATVLNASSERLRSESQLVGEEVDRTVATLRDAVAKLSADSPTPTPQAAPPAPTPPAPEPPPAFAPSPPDAPAATEPSIPTGPAGSTPNEPDSAPASAQMTPITAYAGTAAAYSEVRGDDQVEALLRATQMAVKGASRDEISQLLRSEYGLSDPSPILDEILGA